MLRNEPPAKLYQKASPFLVFLYRLLYLFIWCISFWLFLHLFLAFCFFCKTISSKLNLIFMSKKQVFSLPNQNKTNQIKTRCISKQFNLFFFKQILFRNWNLFQVYFISLNFCIKCIKFVCFDFESTNQREKKST